MKTQLELTKELIEASNAYYNSGISVMSDIEFDHKIEELKKMEQESGIVYSGSPTQNVGAIAVTKLEKVRHEYPALSLDKVKYKDKKDLITWLSQAPANADVSHRLRDPGIISWKNDGLTVCVTYDDGKLVRAVTRGDGEEGSDITHNARYFVGLPQEIPYKGHLVVRGEAVMKTAEFERVNALSGGIYENPRNLASATIQMLDANESRQREITFIAFELVVPSPDRSVGDLEYQEDRFMWLTDLGFNVVQWTTCNTDNILRIIEDFKGFLPVLDYPTDGLVISYNDMVYGMKLGNTGHHFRHSIALKWSDETAPTTIRDIEWSVGKTGIITPVAVFDEVRLGLGSNVSRASMHNISIIERLTGQNDIATYGADIIGSKAEVYLANMIIPQIMLVDRTENTTTQKIPSTCPVCGAATVIKTSDTGIKVLTCPNHKGCSAQQVGRLMNTFSKDGLFIKGLGESQIEDLITTGLSDGTPSSFYFIANENRANLVYPKESEFVTKVEALLSKDGWGSKKWDNLILAIEASRKTTLQKFLYSLNIPLLGTDLSKKLAKFWKEDIDQFKDFIGQVRERGRECGYTMLVGIDGVGDEKAGNIVDWIVNMVNDPAAYDNFTSLMSELSFPEASVSGSDNSLEGLTFVITGSVHEYKNRDEFKESVEKRGGKVAGSVSAKTNYLVNNDVESTSGKNKKAKELGIEIISEDDFIQKFGK